MVSCLKDLPCKHEDWNWIPRVWVCVRAHIYST